MARISGGVSDSDGWDLRIFPRFVLLDTAVEENDLAPEPYEEIQSFFRWAKASTKFRCLLHLKSMKKASSGKKRPRPEGFLPCLPARARGYFLAAKKVTG